MSALSMLGIFNDHFNTLSGSTVSMMKVVRAAVRIGKAYEKYQRELTKYIAGHYGGWELAEDAVQQAYTKAFLRQEDFTPMPEPAVRAWLYAAARNAAIDMLRKDKRLMYEFDFDSQPEEPPPDAADGVALREGIEKLDELKQRLLDMRYYQGYNSTEMSGMTGMPSSTVRYHLMTALRELREQLKGDLS